jgi:hypothetical protein
MADDDPCCRVFDFRKHDVAMDASRPHSGIRNRKPEWYERRCFTVLRPQVMRSPVFERPPPDKRSPLPDFVGKLVDRIVDEVDHSAIVTDVRSLQEARDRIDTDLDV